jgi:hypothetical protein
MSKVRLALSCKDTVDPQMLEAYLDQVNRTEAVQQGHGGASGWQHGLSCHTLLPAAEGMDGRAATRYTSNMAHVLCLCVCLGAGADVLLLCASPPVIAGVQPALGDGCPASLASSWWSGQGIKGCIRYGCLLRKSLA